MNPRSLFIGLAGLFCLISCSPVPPPAPVGPLPSARQLAWHELEYYAFIHFNMNTFTNREWGLGDESPDQFNPSSLDTEQWAKVAKEAGMKGIILTAKHHDGFCLWPTATTEHSVKNSAWKQGKGDVVRDLAEACKAHGLKFGVYLSPWDRNNAAYGTPAYVETFHRQLEELLTGYGDLFEVWFDGANGGSGYYGGANETRKIDNKTYYQWDKATALIRQHQPQAVIFSDGGPDIRWVGNENGRANETNWSIMRRDEIFPGWPRYKELRGGHEDGTHWLPAEADVSIRPGWYYHPHEDHRVKNLPELLDIYYQSVGRNAALLLNLPVDKRGLVHEQDVAQLLALKSRLDEVFANDLAPGAALSASDIRGNSDRYSVNRLTDGSTSTYWATGEGTESATLTCTFDSPTEVNRLLLQEYIALGQRVQEFRVSVLVDGEWQEIDSQTTIGYKRILRFPTVKTEAIRIDFHKSKGPLALSRMSVYHAPPLLVPPAIHRSRDGVVTLESPDRELEIHFTLDGRAPDRDSQVYTGPFVLHDPATVQALAIDTRTGSQTPVAIHEFDISRKEWKVIATNDSDENLEVLLDEDPHTFWTVPEENREQEVILDLGKAYDLFGFTYWPMQERYPSGIFTDYEFYGSKDGKNWDLILSGEFGNILNNPVQQRVDFKKSTARFIKLRASGIDGSDQRATFADLGVITRNRKDGSETTK